MALVKGICKNYGECDLADNKEVQEAEKSNFVCEECGKPLHPIGSGGSSSGSKAKANKGGLIGGICAALVALGGASFGVWKYVLSDDGPKAERVQLDMKEAFINMGVTAETKLNAAVLDAKGNVINDPEVVCQWASSDTSIVAVTQDGKVTAAAAGNALVVVRVNGTECADTCKVEVTGIEIPEEPADTVEQEEDKVEEPTTAPASTPASTPAPKNPKWGRYSGERNANGVPDGQGELKITRSHDINGETASPGETIKGVFRNGYVNMGKWYKNDGNVVIVKDVKIL